MEPENPMLLESQSRIQDMMQASIGRLLAAPHADGEWEAEIQSVRFVSEQSWVRCNAFLFAYTAARFAAIVTPVAAPDRSGDPFAERFAAAVAEEDAARAIAIWTAQSAVGPKIGGPRDQSGLVAAVLSGLRSASASILPDNVAAMLPAPCTREVWFEASAGSGGDVI